MRFFSVSSLARSGAVHLALLTVLFAVGASAQSAAVVRKGSYEIGGMIGASYGIDKFRVMGGGNVTFAATRVVLPYFEYTYFPGLNRQFDFTIQDTGRSGSSIYEVPLTDVHAGVHIRIPVAESKFVPYLVAGLGMIRSPARDVVINVGTAGGGVGTFTDTTPADTSLAANFGGGLRYYVNQRFGFRLEAKAYTPLSDFAGTEIGTPQTKVFSKFVGGIFIQLR